MSDASIATAEDFARPAKAAKRAGRKGRYFFLGAALLMLAGALLSFSSTFYLRGIVLPPRPPLPIRGYLILHGMVMTSWYTLFAVQAFLVGSGRPKLHRRLGVAGAILAACVVLTGGYAAWKLPAHILAVAGLPLSQQIQFHVHEIVIGDLAMLPFFAGLVTAAILLRRRREWHGRLMYWAFVITLGPLFGGGGTRMLTPALEMVLPTGWQYFVIATLAVAPAALLVHDLRVRRRVHPATLVGWAVVALAEFACAAIAETAAGQAFFLSLA